MAFINTMIDFILFSDTVKAFFTSIAIPLYNKRQRKNYVYKFILSSREMYIIGLLNYITYFTNVKQHFNVDYMWYMTKVNT